MKRFSYGNLHVEMTDKLLNELMFEIMRHSTGSSEGPIDIVRRIANPLGARNPYMRISANVVIIRSGRIAAIKSHKNGGAFELPGGKAELNEHPAQTAIRECEEEVGVTPKLERLLVRMPLRGLDCWCFLATIPDHLELVSGKEGLACWATPLEISGGTYSEHTEVWLPAVTDLLW